MYKLKKNTNRVDVGVDPDSEKNAFAIYENNKLTYLAQWSLYETIEFLQSNSCRPMTWHIENVNQNSALHSNKRTKIIKVNENIVGKIGKCQQAQVELERIILCFPKQEIKHYRISKKWKKIDKIEFNRITKWSGPGNEETRSAAYFGFLGTH